MFFISSTLFSYISKDTPNTFYNTLVFFWFKRKRAHNRTTLVNHRKVRRRQSSNKAENPIPVSIVYTEKHTSKYLSLPNAPSSFSFPLFASPFPSTLPFTPPLHSPSPP